MTSINGTSGTTASTGTTGATGTGTSAASGTDGLGKDTFLKLLVAQLKYQNPLQPTDGQEYMSQMAQFTTVEKLADIQKSQTDLVSWQRAVAGQGMIGKQITATTTGTGAEVSGTVTGLKFTDAGPRLVLSSGQTVGVEEVTGVTGVTAPSAGVASTTPATSTSGGTTSGTATTGTTTTGSTATSGTATSGTSTGTSTSGTTTTGTGTSGTSGTGTSGTTTSGTATTGTGTGSAA